MKSATIPYHFDKYYPLEELMAFINATHHDLRMADDLCKKEIGLKRLVGLWMQGIGYVIVLNDDEAKVAHIYNCFTKEEYEQKVHSISGNRSDLK